MTEASKHPFIYISTANYSGHGDLLLHFTDEETELRKVKKGPVTQLVMGKVRI